MDVLGVVSLFAKLLECWPIWIQKQGRHVMGGGDLINGVIWSLLVYLRGEGYLGLSIFLALLYAAFLAFSMWWVRAASEPPGLKAWDMCIDASLDMRSS